MTKTGYNNPMGKIIFIPRIRLLFFLMLLITQAAWLIIETKGDCGSLGWLLFWLSLVPWVFILQKMELSLSFPLISISLMLHPPLLRLFFQKPLPQNYFIGAIVIFCGVILLENPYREPKD
jgi:drug/metabolite transporter (DMT)-like permease